ncbi:MAG: hypothetical protein ABIO46_04105 [Chitinophagales bacterium]
MIVDTICYYDFNRNANLSNLITKAELIVTSWLESSCGKNISVFACLARVVFKGWGRIKIIESFPEICETIKFDGSLFGNDANETFVQTPSDYKLQLMYWCLP